MMTDSGKKTFYIFMLRIEIGGIEKEDEKCVQNKRFGAYSFPIWKYMTFILCMKRSAKDTQYFSLTVPPSALREDL